MVPTSTDDYRSNVDANVVRRLLSAQFPHWSDLAVAEVANPGWDNLTFRLGSTMTVRLPSAPGYAEQVLKEWRWLPILARELPIPIPTPLELGKPSRIFPQAWAVNSWLDGEPLDRITHCKNAMLASDVAEFLQALPRIGTTDGPLAGAHSAFRGCALETYDVEVKAAVEVLGNSIHGKAVLDCWNEALAAEFEGTPVWFHGDVASGNLLTCDGRLAGVIDFGCLGVGDPACDLVIAWTVFEDDARRAFQGALETDADTWARAMGWALWKAVITIAGSIDATASRTATVRAEASHVLDQVVADWRAGRASR